MFGKNGVIICFHMPYIKFRTQRRYEIRLFSLSMKFEAPYDNAAILNLETELFENYQNSYMPDNNLSNKKDRLRIRGCPLIMSG